MTQIQSHTNESLINAAKYFNDGDLEKADFVCRHLISNDSSNADAFHLMALIAVRRNKLDDSIKLLQKACQCRPNDFEFLTNLGNLTKASGNIIEARRYYEEAIAANPKGVVAFNNLALLLAEQGAFAEAISVYESAIAIDKTACELYFNLSTIYRAKGDRQNAIESCRQALEIKPDSFEFRIHLANLYFEINNIVESLTNFSKASQLNPGSAIAFNGIGVCQTALGNYLLAKEALLKAIGLPPSLADAQNNLASVDFLLGEFDDAMICLKAALKLRPDYPEALRNYGNVLAAQHHYAAAIDFYKKSLQLREEFYEAHLDLAVAYKNSGEAALAKSSFEQAAKLDPQSLMLLCGCMGASLPSFYRSGAEINNYRAEYLNGLDELEKRIEKDSYNVPDMDDVLLLAQPTYLSYQGLDDLAVHKRYGKLLETVMARKYPQWSKPKRKRILKSGEKIRLGIVSRHFSNHVDWKIIMDGIVSHIDRESFELFAYSTGGLVDDITKIVSKKVSNFYRSSDVARICEQIERDNIDILFFPELGIDPISMKIASLRTAAIQCCAWGRPDTSGLSTIDYFLSPQIMEPDNAHSHYQEELVLIPDTGFYYEPQGVSDESVEKLSLRADSIKFLCVQSLFKYMPQHDHVFTEIAKNVPNAQFIFVGRPEALAAKFFERLSNTFTNAGLDVSKFVTMLPPLNYSQYINLCRRADIFLDSIGYSGCLTALDAIEQNLPIVTVDGALMRGRQSAGLLGVMNLKETIALNEQDYIRIAIKLAQNKEERDSIAQRISAEKKKLFGNRLVVKKLEETFKSW